jgi:hypothetical protein
MKELMLSNMITGKANAQLLSMLTQVYGVTYQSFNMLLCQSTHEAYFLSPMDQDPPQDMQVFLDTGERFKNAAIQTHPMPAFYSQILCSFGTDCQ